jgi:hypothetical protein
MGGTNGEIRGKTKSEVYRGYREQAAKWEEAQDGDCIPDPADKLECYEKMRKVDSEWLLSYHFHT